MLLSGKLNAHLAEIDRQAEEMFERLTRQMAAEQGVTERLKAENQMAWVGAMNNIPAPAWQAGSWYEKLGGAPSRTDWEKAMGRPIPSLGKTVQNKVQQGSQYVRLPCRAF